MLEPTVPKNKIFRKLTMLTFAMCQLFGWLCSMRFLAIRAMLISTLFVSSPSIAQKALWDVLSQLSCLKGMVISCDTSEGYIKSDVDLASIVDFDKNVVYTTRVGENGTIIQPPLTEEKKSFQ